MPLNLRAQIFCFSKVFWNVIVGLNMLSVALRAESVRDKGISSISH